MMSVSNLGNLKMVVLKNPYSLWMQNDSPEFQDLFHKIVGLKLRGYGAEYPEGVLAVDTSDFVATHLLVCRQDRSALIPLMGFKTTLLRDCQKHRISFPGLGLVQAAEAPQHVQAVKKIIDRCQQQEKQLAYTGGWTIDPEVRQNRALTKELNEWFHTLYVLFHLENQIDEIITGGTVRFKADSMVLKMGHNPLQSEQGALPPISVKHLFDEKVLVTHLTSFSENAIERTKPYRQVWMERIELTGNVNSGETRLRPAG